jgi:hypothetical protein
LICNGTIFNWAHAQLKKITEILKGNGVLVCRPLASVRKYVASGDPRGASSQAAA